MNKNIVIAIVLGALVLIAAVQAVQLFTLKNKLAGGQISVGTPTQSGATGSPQLPSSLAKLPSQVGGC